VASLKIGFISPKSVSFFRDEKKNEILNSLPGFAVHSVYWSGLSTSLPILASLTPPGTEMEIIDENVEPVDFSRQYDIVAVTAMTHQAVRAYQIAAEFRKQGVYTVLGGIHISAEAEEAARYADTVIVGEAESAWPRFLSDFQEKSPQPLYSSIDCDSVIMTNLPVPRYDLLKGKGYRMIWINTERGCPYDCEFCSVTTFFGKKNRHKSLEQIVREIEFIKYHFDRIYIGFCDNNIFLNKRFARQLVEKLADLSIRWVGQSDIAIADDKTFLPDVLASGCQVLLMGLESLNPENLEDIYSKGRKLKFDYLSHYAECIETIQGNGIGIFGSFIIGLDHDLPGVLDNITDFVVKTNLMTAMINVLTPLPGTRLRERLVSENRVLPTSWENYTLRDINMIFKNLSYSYIEDNLLDAYRKVYNTERMKKTANYFKRVFRDLYRGSSGI
jgi:radical SAM superfamily enzyme YgiQ (UPF0313 family)